MKYHTFNDSRTSTPFKEESSYYESRGRLSNLSKVKSTVLSEPVFCDLSSIIDTVTVHEEAKFYIITWENLGVTPSLFVFIFIQITSEPAKSAKLLFDLNDCVGRLSFGIRVFVIACKNRQEMCPLFRS